VAARDLFPHPGRHRPSPGRSTGRGRRDRGTGGRGQRRGAPPRPHRPYRPRPRHGCGLATDHPGGLDLPGSGHPCARGSRGDGHAPAGLDPEEDPYAAGIGTSRPGQREGRQEARRRRRPRRPADLHLETGRRRHGAHRSGDDVDPRGPGADRPAPSGYVWTRAPCRMPDACSGPSTGSPTRPLIRCRRSRRARTPRPPGTGPRRGPRRTGHACSRVPWRTRVNCPGYRPSA
jgi:hypothetical protein